QHSVSNQSTPRKTACRSEGPVAAPTSRRGWLRFRRKREHAASRPTSGERSGTRKGESTQGELPVPIRQTVSAVCALRILFLVLTQEPRPSIRQTPSGESGFLQTASGT